MHLTDINPQTHQPYWFIFAEPAKLHRYVEMAGQAEYYQETVASLEASAPDHWRLGLLRRNRDGYIDAAAEAKDDAILSAKARSQAEQQYQFEGE
jgi:hypothetical protein